MKTWKLVSGILCIVLLVVVMFQSCAVGCMNTVEGSEDAQITLELEPETEYKVSIDTVSTSGMKTNLGGKLVLSVELGEGKSADVKVEKL